MLYKYYFYITVRLGDLKKQQHAFCFSYVSFTKVHEVQLWLAFKIKLKWSLQHIIILLFIFLKIKTTEGKKHHWFFSTPVTRKSSDMKSWSCLWYRMKLMLHDVSCFTEGQSLSLYTAWERLQLH